MQDFAVGKTIVATLAVENISRCDDQEGDGSQTVVRFRGPAASTVLWYPVKGSEAAGLKRGQVAKVRATIVHQGSAGTIVNVTAVL